MIQALALRKGNQIDFLQSGQIGSLVQIPTPTEGGQITGDYYALPVNTNIYAGWRYVPYNAANSPKTILPLNAIPCTELTMANNSDTFIIACTSAQYVTASLGGAALPTNLAYLNGAGNAYNTAYRIHATDLLYAVQRVYGANSNGIPAIVLALPALSGSLALFPFGNVNGVEANPTATLAGTTYATPAALLAYFNASWNVVNGVNITWTLSADNVTMIGAITNFTALVSFSGGIVAVDPAA